MSSPTDAARFRTVVHDDDAVGKIEAGEAIGDRVDEEVQRPVEEREQPDHPAEANQRSSSRSDDAAA